jgi:Gpi18-like mannosyltransferase
LIIAGLSIKVLLLPKCPVKGDFEIFINPWIEFIKAHGYFSALKYDFSNYSPAYLNFLVIIAKLGFNTLFSVKILSIFFEYATAFFIGRFLYESTGKKYLTLFTLAIYPLLPTVIINSSYWAQCDSIYTCFIAGGLFFLFKKKAFLSFLFLGIALSFKLQTVIIIPFYFVLLIRKQVKWYYFLMLPLIYFLSILPACFSGKPLLDLLTVYLKQSVHYGFLTMNFPNIYIWFNNDYYHIIKNTGLFFTATVCLLSIFLLKNKPLNQNLMVKLVFLYSIFIPFILPGMHERYMFLGDTLATAYLLLFLKKIYIPVGVIFISFMSYFLCSKFRDYIPVHSLSVFYLFIIICLFKDIYREMKLLKTKKSIRLNFS